MRPTQEKTTAARKSATPETPVARRSRADEVYEQLKRDIADFKLVPGDRFAERSVTQRLEVSRTPVRQALAKLQQEGFVEVLFRSGWRAQPEPGQPRPAGRTDSPMVGTPGQTQQ